VTPNYDCADMTPREPGWGAFGLASLVSMLVLALWAQLTPLGSAPDEASHFIKSAAVVRGELTGQDVPGWLLSIDGWVHDRDVGVKQLVVVGDGNVLHREAPNTQRDDVTSELGIAQDTIVGYSIWVLDHVRYESYQMFAELNDGRLVSLDLLGGANVLTSPGGVLVEGRVVVDSDVTVGLVEDSHLNGRMEYSHWSTIVDLDPRFDGANSVQRCFVSQASVPGCGLQVQDQTPATERPITAMGRYAPAMYLVPGVGTFLGATNTAWYLGRFVSALAASLLVSLGVVVLARRRLSLLPLVGALAPAVLFLSSVVNPSGLEIIGAIAVWVSLPGILAAGRSDRFETACFAIGGVVLILSRPLGMVYFAVIVAICFVAHGSSAGGAPEQRSSLRGWLRRILHVVQRHPVVTGVQLVTLSFATWWYVFIYNSVVDPRRAEYLAPNVPLSEQVAHGFGDIFRVLLEAVGDLGSLEVPVPRLVFLSVIVTVVWLISRAWQDPAATSRHVKIATLALVVVSVLLVVATDVNYYRILRGYGVQGRHLTPWLVGLPLLAARSVRLSRRGVTWVVAVWAVGQSIATYAALRRYSVGIIGDNFFAMFSQPAWQPPLRIVPTLVLMSVSIGVAAMFIARYERVRLSGATDVNAVTTAPSAPSN
jgi:hypothetical protein